MAIKILIDTGIWSLGLKAPFLAANDSVFQEAAEGQTFLRTTLETNAELLFSSHLLAEIYHVLTASGNQIPADQAKRLIDDLLARRGTIYRPITPAVLSRSLDMSAASAIPVWDYLVALPFEDTIDKIYTLDPHFQHPSLAGLAQIQNPLGIWKSEGEDF